MRKSLKTYGFSEQIVNAVKLIIEKIERNQINEAEQEIARLSLEICERIKNKNFSPKEADSYFTLIDLYLTDNYKDLKLDKRIEDIIFEGMLLHDYGKDYGANLETIIMLAKGILNKKSK